MDDRFEPDPFTTPVAVLLAQPLIARFARAPECPPEHRWHACTTLPVLALFVSMCADAGGDALAWEALDPDALVGASLDADAADHAFLCDLLDVSAAFYHFLAREGLVPDRRALELRVRLTTLALGLASA